MSKGLSNHDLLVKIASLDKKFMLQNVCMKGVLRAFPILTRSLVEAGSLRREDVEAAVETAAQQIIAEDDTSTSRLEREAIAELMRSLFRTDRLN